MIFHRGRLTSILPQRQGPLVGKGIRTTGKADHGPMTGSASSVKLSDRPARQKRTRRRCAAGRSPISRIPAQSREKGFRGQNPAGLVPMKGYLRRSTRVQEQFHTETLTISIRQAAKTAAVAFCTVFAAAGMAERIPAGRSFLYGSPPDRDLKHNTHNCQQANHCQQLSSGRLPCQAAAVGSGEGSRIGTPHSRRWDSIKATTD